MLGSDALNEDKLLEEGEWKNTHTQILIGYEVNVGSFKICLHDAKILGAWEVINGPVFTPGNRVIPAKKVQALRGLINHWQGANRFWKYMTARFNSLLSFTDGTNSWIRCESDQR